MTKLETIAYYEAIGDTDKLVTIEYTDTLDIITSKIKNKTDTQDINTIYIEIFQRDKNITSYSLTKFSTDIFDLWKDKDSQLSKVHLTDIVDFIYHNLPLPIESPYVKFVHSKNEDGTYNIHSFKDANYEEIIDPKNISMDTMTDYILGQLVFDDGRIEYHCVNNEDLSQFDYILENIQDDNIKLFAHTILQIVPSYIFTIPEGISGQHNSASDLAEKGLLRHINNACKIFLALTYLDYAKIKFTQHEKDMMLVAVLFSDMLKHGWQEDYEISHVPKYEHPKLMADVVRAMPGILAINELNFIANCIESHMGQFAAKKPSNYPTVMPMPDTEYKYTVHLSNFLVSLKDITYINNNEIYVFDTEKVTTIKSYTIVGQHDLQTITNALDEPIDMELAVKLGITHKESDIIDTWQHILITKHASDKQLKYIDLAKQMIFE